MHRVSPARPAPDHRGPAPGRDLLCRALFPPFPALGLGDEEKILSSFDLIREKVVYPRLLSAASFFLVCFTVERM